MSEAGSARGSDGFYTSASIGPLFGQLLAARLAAWSERLSPESVQWVRRFYLFLIPATIALMMLHNLGDWLRKLIWLRTGGVPRPPLRGELRMFPFERV